LISAGRMKPSTDAIYTSVLLSFAGGFCDAVTFVVVAGMFSAHVTGNFIEFSRDLVFGARLENWLKLLVFPVFILAVMTGGIMLYRLVKPSTVLYAEGTILIICGLLGMLNVIHFKDNRAFNYILALGIVFAMGLQNAFGKIYAKNLKSSTTVMAGNMTQFSLDMASSIIPGNSRRREFENLKFNLWVILAFLAGALAGSTGAKILGIAAVILPAAGVLHLSFKSNLWSGSTKHPAEKLPAGAGHKKFQAL
jgi:uncharacterized membrane protein YoaK (UPF0700 family)